MEKFSDRSRRASKMRAVSVMIGAAVNVVLASLSYKAGLPVVADTIGTVAITAVGGIFPGIMTAILTNAVCSLFNSEAAYFSLINAMIAMYTAWAVRDKNLKKPKNIASLMLVLGIGSGIFSAFIQWGVLGGVKNDAMRSLIEAVGEYHSMPAFPLFLAINVLLNLIDKAVSVGVMLLVLYLMPKSTRTMIKNSGWRQHPLSFEEIKKLQLLSRDIRYPLKNRMTVMFLTVTLSLTALMAFVGSRLFYRNQRQEKTESAIKTAKFAAEMVDADMMDDYIKYGSDAEGYDETSDLLSKIRENASGVQYLYIIQIRADGCYVAFDVETSDTPAYSAGDKIDFEEAFEPYLPALFAGEEIEPIESNDISGWLLTAYYPIRNESGRCTGYAGADISLKYMADSMGDLVLRIALILSGFFVLIIAYALWVTGINLVYPINNIVAAVGDFIGAGTDQKKLDESVRKLRAIDVHTGDEVEKLFHAICDMAVSQTEQMRSIRRFSENTARMQDGLIITMADLVENRDSDTGAHIQKTAAYVKIIVEGLKRKGYYAEKLTPKFMSDVVRSAPLHDIGKISIPDNVLNKKGKLNEAEYEIIKTHTTAGRIIMEKAINTVEGENYLKEARNMAAYHHERWDGKGYPEGLHGEVIPLSARIMAVADVFDALASPRVYKPAFPLEKALSIIQEGSGTQFDPKCVEVFMEALPEVKTVLSKYSENGQGGAV
ncbi:HD-GYP domain-containing protein [Ruminococcus albus]|uniref:HD domain protein n=1 Tax=Ruminococcus albus 8 TaxID=246199 RepID=E9SBA8_RUMAL|nr:HD domain-containing phosphohydrolase [Ruminococcus albus]EGC03477.1 HD domain protein [Ruminococcus albus 8]MCC3350259.1 HD domain-containing protein [Ruminococcus albus 8]